MPPAPPLILAFAPRERTRALLRGSLPRRRRRILAARTPGEFEAAFGVRLVDAALVDLGGAAEQVAAAVSLAPHYPSVAFIGVSSWRSVDGPAIGSAIASDFVDVLAEGTDDRMLRSLLDRHGFAARFARVLADPPASLGLVTPLQRSTWSLLVGLAGQTVRTSALASALGVTREHLSRSFAATGPMRLKGLVDLVRLLAASVLAKNPGHGPKEIAEVLGFSSLPRLGELTRRVLGTSPASLSRLRAEDVIGRFVRK